jgi:hypothetical protein
MNTAARALWSDYAHPKANFLGCAVSTHCAPICQIAPQTRFGDLNTSIDQPTTRFIADSRGPVRPALFLSVCRFFAGQDGSRSRLNRNFDTRVLRKTNISAARDPAQIQLARSRVITDPRRKFRGTAGCAGGAAN